MPHIQRKERWKSKKAGISALTLGSCFLSPPCREIKVRVGAGTVSTDTQRLMVLRLILSEKNSLESWRVVEPCLASW